MIRSSKHSIKFSNKNKLEKYQAFIQEYRRVGSIIIETIWNNGYQEFNIQNDTLQLPKYLDYKDFDIPTDLSARALSSLVTQVSGVIRGVVKKRKDTLYAIFKNPKLCDKLKLPKISQPNFSRVNPELSSKCADTQIGNSFDYFIRLKSLGKSYGRINIPLKGTKVSKKWNINNLMTSFILSNSSISLRYTVDIKLKSEGTVVGLDQGILDVATLSDGTVSGHINSHGYTLKQITNILSRRRKGSRSFKKAQDHRKNFINWSINQLNLTNVKQIKLEKIINIGFGKTKSRFLSHFTNTLIRDKVKRYAEEQEVLVTEIPSTYRSQRCSNCGLVRKANRKGKLYSCNSCKFESDSDLNAAINLNTILPEIDFAFRSQRNNLGKGFYYLPEGLFSFDGEEFRVPLSNNEDIFL